MLISHAIEQRIVAAVSNAIDTAGVVNWQIFGAWSPADAFAVKNEEDPETVATVAVVVSTPASPTFTAPQVTLAGTVTVTVRVDLDPSGSSLLAIAEAVANLLNSWQSDTYQQCFDALDVVDTDTDECIFSADEISIESAVPRLDRDRKLTTLSFPFTLSGVLTPSPQGSGLSSASEGSGAEPPSDPSTTND